MANKQEESSTAMSSGAKCLQEIWDHHLQNVPPPIGLDSYEPRPTDVILTALVKSGSTFILQMLYQIVVHSGGASNDPTGHNYTDQMQVTPWLEFLPYFTPLQNDTTPRIFKTHASISSFLPLRSKHVVVLRNPIDIAGSFLDFLFDAIVRDSSLKSHEVREETFDAFCEQCFLQPIDQAEMLPPNWFEATKAATQPLRDDVHVLFYEDIIQDPERTVRTLAKFINCDISDTAVTEVMKVSTREHMVNDEKFYGTMERNLFKIPGEIRKVKPERTSGFSSFGVKATYVHEIEKKNMEIFGVRTYDEIRQTISKQQADRFGR